MITGWCWRRAGWCIYPAAGWWAAAGRYVRGHSLLFTVWGHAAVGAALAATLKTRQNTRLYKYTGSLLKRSTFETVFTVAFQTGEQYF